MHPTPAFYHPSEHIQTLGRNIISHQVQRHQHRCSLQPPFTRVLISYVSLHTAKVEMAGTGTGTR